MREAVISDFRRILEVLLIQSSYRLPAGKHLQKSVLTKPKPTWWPAAAREGLSIRALTREEVEEVGTRRG